VHPRLAAMGFTGGERTTRRAVAQVKARLRAGQCRVFRPWVAEPGLWLQWDWGEGPRVGGRRTNLWCAWLAWSRFRVVMPQGANPGRHVMRSPAVVTGDLTRTPQLSRTGDGTPVVN
jgi:hypothetical protein